MEIKDVILSQGSAARTLSLALKHVAYSGDLTDQLLNHSKVMESLYDKTCAALASEDPEDKMFRKILKLFAEKKAWFDQAEARFDLKTFFF